MTITKMVTGSHKGEWRVRIQPVDQVTGKRVKVPIQYSKNKNDAKKAESRLWTNFEMGYTYRNSDKIFAESFKIFIKKQFEIHHWSKRTYSDWQYSAEIFDEYFKLTKIRNVNKMLVDDFAHQFVYDHHLAVSPDGVIGKRLIHMRSFFKPLVGESIQENPVPIRAIDYFFRTDEQSLKKRSYVLSDTEINDLQTLIKQRVQDRSANNQVTMLAIWMGLKTGMRPQEIQAIKWSDFHDIGDYHVLQISDAWNEKQHEFNGHLKARMVGESRQTLPIPDDLFLALQRFKVHQSELLSSVSVDNTKGLVFLTLRDLQLAAIGTPVTQSALNEMVTKLGKEVGIDPDKSKYKWSMYSLRHTVATKWANQPGMSYPWLADRLGHTVQELMRTYVHVDQDKSTEMMDLLLR